MGSFEIRRRRYCVFLIQKKKRMIILVERHCFLLTHTLLRSFFRTTAYFLLSGLVDFHFWGNVGNVEVHAALDEKMLRYKTRDADCLLDDKFRMAGAWIQSAYLQVLI